MNVMNVCFDLLYEGCSVNFANGFVTLFSDMQGKHTMHVLKGLPFAFKMVPNTVQNNSLLS